MHQCSADVNCCHNAHHNCKVRGGDNGCTCSISCGGDDTCFVGKRKDVLVNHNAEEESASNACKYVTDQTRKCHCQTGFIGLEISEDTFQCLHRALCHNALSALSHILFHILHFLSHRCHLPFESCRCLDRRGWMPKVPHVSRWRQCVRCS